MGKRVFCSVFVPRHHYKPLLYATYKANFVIASKQFFNLHILITCLFLKHKILWLKWFNAAQFECVNANTVNS